VSTDREVVRKALPSVVLGKMKMTFRMVFCSYKRIGREYFVHLTMNIFEDVVECVRHSASLLFEFSFMEITRNKYLLVFLEVKPLRSVSTFSFGNRENTKCIV